MRGVPWQAYVDRLWGEHHAHHAREIATTRREIDEARHVIDHRLELLNQLRDDVVKDRSQFVNAAEYAAQREAADQERQRLQDQIDVLARQQENWRGRQGAFLAVMTVALVLVPVVVSALFFLVDK